MHVYTMLLPLNLVCRIMSEELSFSEWSIPLPPADSTDGTIIIINLESTYTCSTESHGLGDTQCVASCVLPARCSESKAIGEMVTGRSAELVEQKWAEEEGPYLPQELVFAKD